MKQRCHPSIASESVACIGHHRLVETSALVISPQLRHCVSGLAVGKRAFDTCQPCRTHFSCGHTNHPTSHYPSLGSAFTRQLKSRVALTGARLCFTALSSPPRPANGCRPSPPGVGPAEDLARQF